MLEKKLEYSLSFLLSPFYRGVFSALVEKHFPAPNRRKTADMFGLDLDHSGASSPANSESGRGTKRKRGIILSNM